MTDADKKKKKEKPPRHPPPGSLVMSELSFSSQEDDATERTTNKPEPASRADANESKAARKSAATNSTNNRKWSVAVSDWLPNTSDPLQRRKHDEKVVGMAEGMKRAAAPSVWSLNTSGRSMLKASRHRGTVEEDEVYARSKAENRPLPLLVIGYMTALKVFVYYLITLDSLVACGLTVGLTVFWYLAYKDEEDWAGGAMSWVLLGFAVVTPMSVSIGIAYNRRERALMDITRLRSFAFQIYLAHAIWDWGKPSENKGRVASDVDWLAHSDAVLEELVGIGDEMGRFLTLPTSSRTRHRMTKSGRREAARTLEVAFRLFDSLYTQRMTRLAQLSEFLKLEGLGAGEASRIRQYERFIGEIVEDLRVIKSYRTPQALRSFARIFTTLLPPFYAPTFAQLARDLNSLAVGIAFAVITSLGLNALFEGIQVLEDPFVAFITLDGIDVREELEVLHYAQLINARKLLFPSAEPFPESPQAALARRKPLAMPPLAGKPKQTHERVISFGSQLTKVAGANQAEQEENDTDVLPLEPSTRESIWHAMFLNPEMAGSSMEASVRSNRPRRRMESWGSTPR